MNIFGTKVDKPFDKMGSKIAEVEEPISRFGMDVGAEFERVDTAVLKSASKFDSLKDTLRNLSKRGLSVLGPPFIAIASRFKRKGAGDIESGGKKVVETLTKMKNSMSVFNDILRQNKLQTFIQSIALDRLNKISEGLQHIGEAGQHLTTGLEAEMAGMAKTARASAVNMGLMGKDVGKFTGKVAGMAKGLNIDVGTAADATWGWSKAMEELRAVGIRSATDLAKLSEVTGLNTKEFALSLKSMRAQFQMTDKDMQQVVGSFTSLGQATGDVGGALGHLPAMMDLISRHSVSMGKKLSPAQLADYAAQTAAVAAGFGKLGKTQTQAMDIAMKLSDQLVSSQENTQNMFTGTSDELDQFTERLSITTGDTQAAFKLMSSGPQKMIQSIARMLMRAKKDGKKVTEVMGFMAGNLRGVLGDQVTADLVTMFDNADESLLKTMGDTKAAVTPLHKLGDAGFSTGRTLEEAYQLMQDSAISRFRAISNVGGKFVKDSGAEFKKWGDAMAKIAKEGGPMGALVKKMSEINVIGIKALLPETLRPMAAVFGTMTAQIMPTIGALGALGFRFTMLLSPVGLIVAGLTAFGVMLLDARMKTKSWGKALGTVLTKVKHGAKVFVDWVKKKWDQAINFMSGFANNFAKAAKDIDWKQIFTNMFAHIRNGVRVAAKFVEDAAKDLWSIITDAFSGSKGKAKTRVGQIIKDLTAGFVEIFKGLFAALAEYDFGKDIGDFLDTLGGTIQKGLAFLGSDTVRDFLSKAVDFGTDTVDKLGKGFLDLFDKATDKLKGLDLGSKIGPLLDTVLTYETHFVEKSEGVLDGWAKRLPSSMGKAFDFISEFVTTLPGKLDKAFDGIETKLHPAMQRIGKGLMELLWTIAKALPGIAWKSVVLFYYKLPIAFVKLGLVVFKFLFKILADILEGIGEWIWKKLAPAVGKAYDVFVGFLEKIKKPFAEAWAYLGDLVVKFKTRFTGILDDTEQFVRGVFGRIKGWMNSPITDVEAAWDGLKASFSKTFEDIKKTILDDIDAVVNVFGHLEDRAKNALTGIWDHVKHLFGHSMNTIIGADMEKTVQVMNDAANTIMDMLEKKIFDVVVSAFPKAFEAAFKKSDAIFDKFTKYQTAHFQKFLDNLIDRFARAWKSLIDMTSSAMQDIGNMVADVSASLAKTQFAYAQMQVEKGKAETAAKDAKAAKEADKVDEKSLSLTDRLIRATHHPDWYHDDYKTLFITQMSALTTQLGAVATAISRSGSVAKGGSVNPTQAKKKVDDFALQGKGISPAVAGKT